MLKTNLAVSFLLFIAISTHAKKLAEVNGQPITDADLSFALDFEGYTPLQKRNILDDALLREQTVEKLISRELLYEKATQEQLDKNSKFKKTYLLMKKQLLGRMLIEKKLGARLTEKAARAYYKRNKRYFRTDAVHAMHILLPTHGAAKKVVALAKKKGADFQALAEKHSKDPSAKNNRGDIGWITRDQMDERFSDAALRAKSGTVTGPIRSDFGYHVIKVVGKKPGRTLSYDEVELRVRSRLRKKLVDEYVNRLRKNAKIKIQN